MSKAGNKEKQHLKTIKRLMSLDGCLFMFVIVLFVFLFMYTPQYFPAEKMRGPQPDSNGNFTDEAKAQSAEKLKDTIDYWMAPEIAFLDTDPDKELIVYGKELIEHTSLYYGEKGKIFKASTNGMNCQNCHLAGGTKVFGNNYASVASTYPKYRARSGSMENIYKRVNDCFERSLNGKAIDTSSKEMRAIYAYIVWLGKDVAKGDKPVGSGMKELSVLERAADADKGKLVYKQKCESCHKTSGEGVLNPENTAYTYPPLWGDHSYNSGAGLFRLSNFAKLVKYNMPFGVDHKSTQLSDEEAWDVAAFVNSQPRPSMDIKNDWPKIEEKPFDHPFGPYKDGFSEKQHKYGPYKEIKEKLDLMKKQKSKV